MLDESLYHLCLSFNMLHPISKSLHAFLLSQIKHGEGHAFASDTIRAFRIWCWKATPKKDARKDKVETSVAFFPENNKETQQTFHHCFNVVIRLIWLREVTQRQINVETTLCLPILKLTTLNVKSTLSISTQILTALDNIETMFFFPTSSFTTLIKSKQSCEYHNLQNCLKGA